MFNFFKKKKETEKSKLIFIKELITHIYADYRIPVDVDALIELCVVCDALDLYFIGERDKNFIKIALTRLYLKISSSEVSSLIDLKGNIEDYFFKYTELKDKEDLNNLIESIHKKLEGKDE
jgi:hypothetical protein